MELDYGTLATKAGVDPVGLLAKLAQGDPAQIEELASHFYASSGHLSQARSAHQKSAAFVEAGYRVDGASPLDYGAEVTTVTGYGPAYLKNGPEHCYRIAKILAGVGDDLQAATKRSRAEVESLRTDLTSIQNEWNAFYQGTGHHLPPVDQESYFQSYVNRAVARIKSHGSVVHREVSSYETTLSAALRSMADLGYVPSEAVDDGAGVPDATSAGNKTVQATTLPGQQGITAFDQATAYLNLLNEKKASGAPLTPAEIQWLKDYYAVVTPHFAEIKTWADANGGIPQCTLDQKPAMPDQHSPFVKMVDRVGNGFLNLTKVVPYDQLPQSARDVIDGDVGTTDNDPNDSHDNHMRRLAHDWPPRDGHATRDPGLDGYAGFMGFLAGYTGPDQTGGHDFTQHVANAAIRWKQELNTIYANSGSRIKMINAYGDPTSGTPDWKAMSPGDFAKTYPDYASSYALSLVSRDHQFSNNWLHTDPAARRTLMGMNWGDGDGAAHVILSATVPGHGVSTQAAATTALDVVRDASSNYQGLAHMANKDVKAAITGVGLGYIDSFAAQPGQPDGSASVGLITLPGGQQVEGLRLDNPTWANYLKFVAASDPSLYATFQTAADERGVYYLHQAMQHGGVHSPAFEEAIAYSSRLTGGVAGAGHAYLNDLAASGAGDDQRTLAQQQLDYAHELHNYETADRFYNSGKTLLELTPLKSSLDTTDTILSIAGLPGIDDILGPKAPDGVDLSSYVSDLDGYVADVAKGAQASDGTLAGADGHLASLIVRANGGIDPTTGQRVHLLGNHSLPDEVVTNVFDLIPNNHLANEMAQSIHAVGAPVTTDGWSTGTAPGVAELGDSSGSWSDGDDQYRIYYGNQTRYGYHGSGWTHGVGYDSTAPDHDPKSSTPITDVPPAG